MARDDLGARVKRETRPWIGGWRPWCRRPWCGEPGHGWEPGHGRGRGWLGRRGLPRLLGGVGKSRASMAWSLRWLSVRTNFPNESFLEESIKAENLYLAPAPFPLVPPLPIACPLPLGPPIPPPYLPTGAIPSSHRLIPPPLGTSPPSRGLRRPRAYPCSPARVLPSPPLYPDAAIPFCL